MAAADRSPNDNKITTPAAHAKQPTGAWLNHAREVRKPSFMVLSFDVYTH
jgi:hypothetical protein